MNKTLTMLASFILTSNAFAIKGDLLEKKEVPNSTCAIYAKNVQVDIGHEKFDRFYCSATLISSDQAITAAHCDEEIISTKLRSYYPNLTYSGVELRCFDKNGLELKSNVQNFIRHPEYQNSDFSKNDIAVINLNSPIPVKPAKIMLTDAIKFDNRNLSSSNCLIAGYGSEVDGLPTLNATYINEAIYGFYEDSGSFVMGMGHAEPGDSGGYFGCQLNGENLLIGIISELWDESVTNVEYVYHHRKWLLKNLKL